MPDKIIFQIGHAIDRLITVPMSNWTLVQGIPLTLLYEEALKKAGGPLTLTAAQRLIDTVRPGDKVVIATGFVILDYLRPETDGPIGAAGLARALSVGLKAIPILVSERTNLPTLASVCNAAGLHSSDYSSEQRNPRQVFLEEFPVDREEARKAAGRFLDRIQPAAMIAVERPGWNDQGVYHTGRGFDVSSLVAKIDYLFEEAKRRGILTIGIGDLGNELGLGYIQEAVKKWVPNGGQCLCPCQGGIAANFVPDLGIICNISNWGAYGMEACLSALLGELEVMHDGELERRMIEESIRAGAIDPSSGLARAFVDGEPTIIHVYIVELLRRIISNRMQESMFKREYRSVWERGQAEIRKKEK